MNYLSQFVPRFADKASDLRNLLTDNTPWTWEPSHLHDFEDLKAEIAKEGCLKYNDTSKPLCLEVDASLRGLGAALVQEGQPISFGSKSLIDCESRYRNIEGEILAIVWGTQKYQTYL